MDNVPINNSDNESMVLKFNKESQKKVLVWLEQFKDVTRLNWVIYTNLFLQKWFLIENASLFIKSELNITSRGKLSKFSIEINSANL